MKHVDVLFKNKGQRTSVIPCILFMNFIELSVKLVDTPPKRKMRATPLRATKERKENFERKEDRVELDRQYFGDIKAFSIWALSSYRFR